MVEIKLEGLDEIGKAIELMPDAMAKQCVEPAMRAGAVTIRKAITDRARQTFRAHTGRLFRGIAVQIKRKKNARGFLLRYKIGLRRDGNAAPWYGRIWETGRKGGPWLHYGRAKRSGRRAQGKPMPLRPFIGPAFEAIYPAAFQQVISIARERVREVIEEISRRAKLKSRGIVS